jgi:hypothetical protein
MAQIIAYTNLTIQFAGTNSADIRLAQSSAANPTAYAYYPGNNAGGDTTTRTRSSATITTSRTFTSSAIPSASSTARKPAA